MDFIASKDDFVTSVKKAFREIDPNFENYVGVVAVGSHSPKDIDEKLDKLRQAREGHIPTLGLCMGMQLMAIEYARNVLGIESANTTEVDPKTEYPIVVKLPKLRVGMKPIVSDGHMVMESHWHHYKFNEEYYAKFARDWAVVFSEDIAEVMRLNPALHRYYIGVQFHPEYQSSKERPHYLLQQFLDACRDCTKAIKNLPKA